MYLIRRTIAATILAAGCASPLAACDFCGAVSLTFSEEIRRHDVSVIATMTKAPQPVKDGATEVTKAEFRIQHVLNGREYLPAKIGEADDATVLYFGDKGVGTQFLINGLDPPAINWGTPVALTKRSVKYMQDAVKLPEKGADRLIYFQDYLEDPEDQLAIDAYDEFAKAPYSEFVELAPRMKRETLLKWIKDTELPNSRKRLYLMMLSACGKAEDIPMLEKLLTAKPEKNKPRTGFEPVIVAYLMLRGPEGLKLVEELFLANKKAKYTDTYATVMAIRFLGYEQKKIPRKRLLAALRRLLDRPEYADLVIADLARWEDWSSMDRLVKLFKDADEETSWVRIPIIQYLHACPLPKAKEKLKELEKIDPESMKRASFILPLGARPRGKPVPAPEPEPEPEPEEAAKTKVKDAPEKPAVKAAKPKTKGKAKRAEKVSGLNGKMRKWITALSLVLGLSYLVYGLGRANR